MAAPEAKPTAEPGVEPGAEPVWTAIRGHLEDLKRPIDEAIRAYPPPIPACDAQYNYLLEQRDRIGGELRRLDAVRRSATGSRDPRAAAEGFIGSSPCIDAAAAGKIQAAAKGASGRGRP